MLRGLWQAKCFIMLMSLGSFSSMRPFLPVALPLPLSLSFLALAAIVLALNGEAAREGVVVEKEAVVGGEHRRMAEGACVDVVVVRFDREKRREAMPRRLSDNDILGGLWL